jgi:1-acyl-sn-glycerol-3-phosphate acyltransferase
MPKGGPWVNPCHARARILAPVAVEPYGGDAVRLRDDVRARIQAAERELAAALA